MCFVVWKQLWNKWTPVEIANPALDTSGNQFHSYWYIRKRSGCFKQCFDQLFAVKTLWSNDKEHNKNWKPVDMDSSRFSLWNNWVSELQGGTMHLSRCICPNIQCAPRLCDLSPWIRAVMCCPAITKSDGTREKGLILHNWLTNLFGSVELRPD